MKGLGTEMKMYKETQSVDKYLNVKFECDCGRSHYAPIKKINIGKGALNSLPEYIKEFGYSSPYIICDKITYEIAAKKCENLLVDAGFKPYTLILRHMCFDEATLGEIVLNKPDNCDLMIGVGTGSITDMLRFSSFKLGLPCFTVATGAPMDGFSASVGIMNVNNLKATMSAHSTEVIIGDTDILKGAPFRMTVAGFADLVAKLNSLNDWCLDRVVNNSHFCDNIYRLVVDYVDDILSKSDKIKDRNPEAIGDIMNGLLLTGAVISLYGTSRPISGAEHHMSHYWEVCGEQQGRQFAMHGEQVAVGTVLTLRFAELLRNEILDFEKARIKAKAFNYKDWEKEILRAYGNAADAIIDLEAKSGKNETTNVLNRIDVIESRWSEIKSLLDGLYPSEKLRSLLSELGCPCDPKEIGITADILKNTFLYAKDTRAVYEIYQLAFDLGVLDKLSNSMIEDLISEGRL